MKYAYTEHGDKIYPFLNGRAFCPICNSIVIAKCGSTNVWHWAHDSIENCDYWNYETKTKWHRDWQKEFHNDDIEVIIKRNGISHIADIVGNNNVIIEIQNSFISADEIKERELFYDKMIWVLNAKRFMQNLDILGFPVDIYMDFLKQYIVYEKGYSNHLSLEN